MFYAMQFCPTGFNNNVTVRAVRSQPFKTQSAAVKAVMKRGLGYVKEQGKHKPIWHNVPMSPEDFLKIPV